MIDFERGLALLRIVQRHGRQNPITGEQLEALTGIDTRVIAEAIGAAAQQGVRVASCGQGYYAPTKLEVQEYLDREKKRLKSLGWKISQVKKNQNNELSLFEEA